MFHINYSRYVHWINVNHDAKQNLHSTLNAVQWFQ